MTAHRNTEYLPTKAVTERFGLSWDYLSKSGLDCYKLGHRTVLWKVSALQAHIAKSRTVAVG